TLRPGLSSDHPSRVPVLNPLGTISKIPLEDLAANLGESQVMKSPMHRRQPVVADLQAPCLTDPGQRALHDPADLAQAAAMRRPLLRQVVFDPALLEALMVAWRAILPVPVQRLRLAPGPTALALDRRDVVHQVHRFKRL